MKPIVDPSIFYWMSVADDVIFVAIAGAVITTIITIIIATYIALEACDLDDCWKEFRKRKRFFVPIIIIDVFLIIVAVFVPSKNTIIEMIVAKSVTPDAITNGVQSVKETVDYIIQKIAELK